MKTLQGTPGRVFPDPPPSDQEASICPRVFSGSDDPEVRLRRICSAVRARASALRGARHGFLPIRNGQLGQSTAVQSRTSCAEPLQQSRHFSRRARSGETRAWPSCSSSSADMVRGSRPTSWPSWRSRPIWRAPVIRAPPAALFPSPRGPAGPGDGRGRCRDRSGSDPFRDRRGRLRHGAPMR